MLGVALEKEVEGDLLLADAGQGVPFRPGTFDAAISISAVQWLCNAETSEESPAGRLSRFFNQLYASLKRGGRAVCQFYPKNDAQKKMVAQAAIKAGFGAGLLEDDMGTKSAKTYLVLTVGGGALVLVLAFSGGYKNGQFNHAACYIPPTSTALFTFQLVVVQVPLRPIVKKMCYCSLS